MGRRGPSYFFLDLIEERIGDRCRYGVGVFTALVGGTASFWINDWIVTVAVGIPAWEARFPDPTSAA